MLNYSVAELRESTFMQEYSDLLEKKNSGQLHVVK